MHTDPFINEYKNEKYPNAVAVVGFPSVGLVGKIGRAHV